MPVPFHPAHPRPLERYGPWAVVTGASDGLGQAFARQLAQAGLDLVLVARRQSVLAALAEELSSLHAIEARVVALDLADPRAPGLLLDATAERDVGLLVAAAGFGSSGPFLRAELASELEMIDVNCRAVAALAHGFGSRLARRGRGGLVLLSSQLAFQGTPLAANYAATKAYVQTLAEGLAIELAPQGVDVLASAPGPVHTGFAARAAMRLDTAESPEVVAAATLAALGRRITVHPGGLARLLAASQALLPRRLRVRVMARVMAGVAGGR
ncbi:SDR family oxidoreductase [Cyanobium sp. Morenito 9A2]|uniref:SDR family NAD(P)-dependent oxidoreductase n=1 Tax=Cyanobium sp. Morenito 9A2 TaxID=2823718 RepID=UPI0020CD5F05|nr:SDR family NAD(P)-dependent oxidoreductase [Cyanobium sp. Morenito 9A2]MCP9850166.1 SDR family NAD(P)-dependent oxidoreductase [Cyanobium sp. Morenito 9A2]